MRLFARFLLPFGLIVVLLSPSVAAAQFSFGAGLGDFLTRSFGGRVVNIIPCSLGLYVMTLVPRGLPPVMVYENYIWTPLSVFARPVIGGQILGTAGSAPGVCFFPSVPPIPLYGFVMTQNVGTDFLGF